jgi:predicted N-acetyltransferase YhbS
MQIEAIHEIDLTRGQDAEIAALLTRAFGDEAGYGSMSFYNQRHHLRLLARIDGVLVGHFALAYRWIRMGDQRVQIVGIGEVATDPDHRGKGIASALMTATKERASATLADFVVLFGVRPLYEGTGFAAKDNIVRHMGIEDDHSTGLLEGKDTKLKVLQLGDIEWDDTAVIDLLGPSF